MNNNLSVNKIAKFLEDSLTTLSTTDWTCCRYILDDDLALYVGWSDGYDIDDDLVFHSQENPSYGINAGIKVRNDSDWADYEYLNFPWKADGEVWDNGISLASNESFEKDAEYFIDEYNKMREGIDSGEYLIEAEEPVSRENEKVKDWYVKTYPEDTLGQSIPEDLTFYDVFYCLDRRNNVYELLAPADDSVIRERVFQELAKIMDVDYDYIYDQWMLCEAEENKPSIDKDKLDEDLRNIFNDMYDNEYVSQDIKDDFIPEIHVAVDIYSITDGKQPKDSSEDLFKRLKDFGKSNGYDITGTYTHDPGEPDIVSLIIIPGGDVFDFDFNGQKADMMLDESSAEEYWNATEIARDGFLALLKFNFGYDSKGNNYIVTLDNNEIVRFVGSSDDYAKEQFEKIKKEQESGAINIANWYYDKIVESEETIIKTLVDKDNNMRVEIIKAPNGRYFNYYYTGDDEHWNSTAGPFENEDEALKMAQKHRPNAKIVESESNELKVKDYEIEQTGGHVYIAYGVLENGKGFSLSADVLYVYDGDMREHLNDEDFDEYTYLNDNNFVSYEFTTPEYKEIRDQLYQSEKEKGHETGIDIFMNDDFTGMFWEADKDKLADKQFEELLKRQREFMQRNNISDEKQSTLDKKAKEVVNAFKKSKKED